MTSSSKQAQEPVSAPERVIALAWSLIAPRLPFLLLALIPLTFYATMARTPVVGDPTEYTFVAHVLGVAHPPGYAFMTLFSKLFQLLIPIGTIAWRTHFVGLVGGTVAAFAVFGMVRALIPNINQKPLTLTLSPGRGDNGARKAGEFLLPLPRERDSSAIASIAVSEAAVRGSSLLLPASFAALIVAFAANHWQHSIHANPHILTAAFLALNLYTLTKWYTASATSARQSKIVNRKSIWLYAFCLSASLGATHHPLTVFALPACVLFVLIVQPRILLAWKTLLTGTVIVLLGTLVWLYFPLRAPQLVGTQFSSNMNTLDGFLDLIFARGLRVNLNAFGLSDQWDRFTVFWTLLRVQHALPIIFLAVLGIGWLALRAQPNTPSRRPLLILYLGAFIGNYLFVMNTVQDVMAYLNGPFLIVGLFAGIGLVGLLDGLRRSRLNAGPREIGLLLALLFLVGPGIQLLRSGPFVSLRNYSEGVDYVASVQSQFSGQREGATLLQDWEHMTPFWYEHLVNERMLAPEDLTNKFVSASLPWVQGVFENLPAGPVYLSRFERSIFDAGFRLRPRFDTYQVVEPGEASLPPELTPIAAQGGEIEIVGYRLPDSAETGDLIDFDLAMRISAETDQIYMPVLKVGDATLNFTTDSHLLTRDWLPGEIIVERFEFATPHNWPTQTAPVTLEIHDLTGIGDTGLSLSLGDLALTAAQVVPNTNQLLGNFRQRAGLSNAWVRNGLSDRRRALWDEPIVAQSADTLHVTLEWRVLDSPEDSYTIFVHLIDLGNRPIIDSLDYTPLGGATPSHLWFPKWLPGQTLLDPYQMPLDGVPPGEYLIEVGIYEQFTKRRLHTHDAAGNILGDRIILGKVIVE